MAKVSLRIYNREIENLVESGQLDEAIAHCRHILNAFPKNLETYRLLGKAYLEAKRYKEATDIFERLLMAVPDDFVAHVGMSIIHDERNSLDAAIWHMERAFEVQPSNAAIQAELQRLFGRRDGVEPPKIRLTRGALAHMYVQGELYPQAISEISSVLDEDPERQDMQVLLARAYFHAGQKSEAAEICSQLLRRYSYCFDANRVLTELIPQTERGESTQVYRHRISELDPYSTFVTGSVFHTDEVPDAAVSLEHLEWDGQPVDMQPEWGDALGINHGDKKPAERDDQPDWLKAAMVGGAAIASTSDEKPDSLSGADIAAGDDQIPEFMREAGWGEDTGTFKEGPGSFDETGNESAEGEIAQGELPDWVRAMAPPGADSDDASLPTDSAGQDEDDVTEWLQGLGDMPGTPSAEEEQPITPAEDLPDWLQSMEPEESPQPESQETPAEEVPASEGEIPDWLQSMKPEDIPQPESQETPGEVEPASEGEIPDWLQSIEPEEIPQPESQETPAEEAPASEGEVPDWLQSMKPEEALTGDEGLPDWLQSLDAEEQAEEDIPPQAATEVGPEALSDWQISDEATESGAVDIADLGTSAQEQDDAVAWLESLASKHGAKPEELVTDPNARKETAPDWVQKASQAGAEQPPVEESAAPQLEEEPVPPVQEPESDIPQPTAESAGVDDLGTSAEEQDDAVAWLESLASKHGAKPEELVTDPNARKETAPDWVQKASQAGAEQPPVEESAVPEEETADSGEQEPTEGEPEWMAHAKEVGESLYSELEEAQTKEPLPPADTDETGMWLRDLGEEGGFTEEQEAEPAAEGDLPDWLSGLDEEQPEQEMPPISETVSETVGEVEPAAESDLPDWLGDLEAEASEQGQTPVAETAQESIGEVDELEPPEWVHGMESRVSEADVSSQETESEELPAWLEGLDKDEQESVTASEEMPAWLQEEAEQEVAQPEPTASSDWKPADEAETVPEPVAPEAQEEALPEPEPEPAPPEPVEPEPQPEPVVQPEREPYREPVTRSRTGMTGMLSSTQDPILIAAQNELTRSNIPAALDYYGKLIKKGKMLEEIIFDLREALYRYPVEVSIHQTLGDAYMRANRLQDALDSYTKAEELLR